MRLLRITGPCLVLLAVTLTANADEIKEIEKKVPLLAIANAIRQDHDANRQDENLLYPTYPMQSRPLQLYETYQEAPSYASPYEEEGESNFYESPYMYPDVVAEASEPDPTFSFPETVPNRKEKYPSYVPYPQPVFAGGKPVTFGGSASSGGTNAEVDQILDQLPPILAEIGKIFIKRQNEQLPSILNEIGDLLNRNNMLPNQIQVILGAIGDAIKDQPMMFDGTEIIVQIERILATSEVEMLPSQAAIIIRGIAAILRATSVESIPSIVADLRVFLMSGGLAGNVNVIQINAVLRRLEIFLREEKAGLEMNEVLARVGQILVSVVQTTVTATTITQQVVQQPAAVVSPVVPIVPSIKKAIILKGLKGAKGAKGITGEKGEVGKRGKKGDVAPIVDTTAGFVTLLGTSVISGFFTLLAALGVAIPALAMAPIGFGTGPQAPVGIYDVNVKYPKAPYYKETPIHYENEHDYDFDYEVDSGEDGGDDGSDSSEEKERRRRRRRGDRLRLLGKKK